MTANPLVDYSPIVRRPRLELPNGARVAFWAGVNIEHYAWGRPALSLAPFTAELVPDPLNYGWRDYGNRVGLWRLASIFEQTGVPLTAIVNADVCEHYPEIVEEGVERGWTWVAHGRNNSTWHVGMDEDAERAELSGVLDLIGTATKERPRGWLGPVVTSTINTPQLLAELGVDYVLDWSNDDQPYPLNVTADRRVLSVPYSAELNDIPIFHLHHQTGPEFEQAVVDAVEVLAQEGAETARVLGVGLHPFIVGQPSRAKYLARALERVAAMDGVWVTTSDEIASWYQSAAPS